MNKVIAGVFGFILSLYLVVPIYNNFQLSRFSRQLWDLEFPQGIVVLEEDKENGKLNGNGNSMDYFACVLVKTEKPQDELEEFLESKKFHRARDHEKECRDKEVVKVESDNLQSKYLEHETITFESLSDETEFQGYYALIIYDGGYDSSFDIRGH